MKLYRYNKETKEYLETIEFSVAPGDPIVMPNDCTTTEPPLSKDKEIVLFNGVTKSWKIEKDYRGLKGFNRILKKPVEITEIGDLPLYFVTKLTPTFQEQKINKIQEIVIAYEETLQKEIKINKIPYKVAFIQIIQEALSNSNTNEITLDFISEGYDVRVVTREKALEVLKQLKLRELLLTLKRDKLKKEVKEVKTPEDLKKIKIKFCISKDLKALANKNEEEIQAYINEEQN